MLKQTIRHLVCLLMCLCAAPSHGQTPLTIAYYDTYFPFSYRADDGTMQGLLIDLMNEALQVRMGVPVRHEGYPWKRAQQRVKDGLADAFVTGATEERRTYTAISTEPVFVDEDVLYTWRGHPRMAELRSVTSVRDLSSFKIVTYLGNGWAEQNLEGMDVRWLARQRTVLEMLSKRRGDVTIENALVTSAALSRLGLGEDVVRVPGVVMTDYAYSLCINRRSPHVGLLRDFDRVIRAMRAEGIVDRITERYRSGQP